MRVFIAVEIPRIVRQELFKIQNDIQVRCVRGNFTREENLHLTLRFIGEIAPDSLEGLKDCIDEVAYKNKRTVLSFGVLGQFPRGDKHIIWLGCDAAKAMEKTVKDLEMSLEKRGFPRERRAFTPHITFGREIILKGKFADLNSKIAFSPVNVEVCKLSLMRSSRSKGILKYTLLYSNELLDC